MPGKPSTTELHHQSMLKFNYFNTLSLVFAKDLSSGEDPSGELN
jgi:hypothetical protein